MLALALSLAAEVIAPGLPPGSMPGGSPGWQWGTAAGRAFAAQPQAEPGVLLSEGQTLLEAGEVARAEALYRHLVTSYPGLAEGHEGLARALEEQGKTEEAAAVLVRLGGGFLAGGEEGKALAPLRHAAELAPGAASIHALLGRALSLSQSFAEGQQALEKAVALGDRSAPTLLFLGAAQWENGALEAAESTLREARELAPGPAGQQLGRLLLWQGHAAEALETLEGLEANASANRGGRSLDLELDLARALEGAGRHEDALAAYRRVVARAPELSQSHYRLARLLARLGERDRAREAMETYRRLYEAELERTREQGLARARLDRAWEALRTGGAELAVALFADLPETRESLRGLALAHSRAGDHTRAAEVLERAVALEPEREELRQLLLQERLRAEEKQGDLR